MKDFRLKGHIAMLGANTMWGLMAPIAKIVMAAGIVSPLLMTNFRIFGAAILFWITSLFLPSEKVTRRDLLLLAGAGMLGIVFNQGCYIFGVGLTSPGEASIITTTMPLWVMLLAALILKEPITLKKFGGILLGGAGALLLVLNGANTSMKGDNATLGDLLVLTAQLCYALYLTFYKNFIKKYSVVTLMKWMFTFASCAMLCISVPTWLSTDWGAMSNVEIWGIGYVVICATYLAYIFTMIGQKNLRPTLVGIYNYAQPVVASIVGIYLGLDKFTPTKIVAVILIFSGVYLVTISKAAQPSAIGEKG
ncbi:MAG: DMT family transporter [Muribaculaceae bacterium]|nr:DMT family transporter [Muribaculaceae bacterium]